MPEYPLPKLEELILGQIIDRFFEPELIGYTQSQVPQFQPSPQGGQTIYPMVPQYRSTPLAETARAIYENQGPQLADKIWEKLVADTALYDRFTDGILRRLIERIERPDAFGYKGSTVATEHFKKLQEQADKLVAEKLAQRQLDEIDRARNAAEADS